MLESGKCITVMQTNKSTITVVTFAVAFLAASCVWMICFLSYHGIPIPPELNTLAGTLCGYLTGVLSKTSPTETTKTQSDVPPKSNEPIPVTVENTQSEPVPVEQK